MRNIALFCGALMLLATEAFSQISLPRPSPAGSTYSQVGLTDVTIDYFRPKMKGRKIFGAGDDYLVPFGQRWRTGANSGTKITFSDDVKVEGADVPAGEYLLITVPNSDTWEFIFYTDPSIGGNLSRMDDSKIQAKVMAKASKLTEPVEVLTFNISDISEDNKMAAIELSWENTSVKAGVTADFDARVLADIEKHTKVNPDNYLDAANFYYASGRDPQQALEWIQLYFAADADNENQFWNLHLMAQIQQAAGDTKGAKATAMKSLEKAKANEGGDFGYIKRNEDLLAKLQ